MSFSIQSKQSRSQSHYIDPYFRKDDSYISQNDPHTKLTTMKKVPQPYPQNRSYNQDDYSLSTSREDLKDLNQTSDHHLQNLLDKSIKIGLQRKTEVDLWKQKYDKQMNQVIQLKTNYECEIQSLTQELQRIQNQLGSMESSKNRTISDSLVISQSQRLSYDENMINSRNQQVDMYEAQLNKLRGIIDDKSVKASQLQTQLERQKAEYGDMQSRLRNEVEVMKNRLTSIQIDHQMEVGSIKNKLDLNKEVQLRNTQNAHDNQTDLMIQDNENLKQLIMIKDDEIQTLIQQSQKTKINQDLECYDLREQIDDLKEKFYYTEEIHQQENHEIQSNLEVMFQQELKNGKFLNEKQTQLINQENLRLKELLNDKQKQLEMQIVEKQQQKDNFDGDMVGLYKQINQSKRMLALKEAERNRQVQDLLQRIQRKDEHFCQSEKQLNSQIELLNQELSNQQELQYQKQNEIDKTLAQFGQTKQKFEDQIQILKDEQDIIKLQAYETEILKNQEILDLKMEFKGSDQGGRENLKQLEVQLDHLAYEQSLERDKYENKSKECENLHTQKDTFQVQIKKQSEENEILIQKLQTFEKDKIFQLEQLQNQMDKGASYQFENLKKAYNTQVSILSDEIINLQNKVEIQDQQFNELIDRYQILQHSFQPIDLKNQVYSTRIGFQSEFITNRTGGQSEHITKREVHEIVDKTIISGESIRKH